MRHGNWWIVTIVFAFGAALLLANPGRGDDSSGPQSARSSKTGDDLSNTREENTANEQGRQAPSADNSATHHAALGISLSESNAGVTVIAVAPGGPAAKAGIRVGDQIRSVDDQRIATARGLIEEIGDRRPGAQVVIGLRRDGQRQSVRATLTSLDMLPARRTMVDRNRFSNRAMEENRPTRSTWNPDRGRSASYDEQAGSSRNNDSISRQIQLLTQQLTQLGRRIDRLQNDMYGDVPAFEGNGDNSWYYEEEPGDDNQGLHDWGARARDGQ